MKRLAIAFVVLSCLAVLCFSIDLPDIEIPDFKTSLLLDNDGDLSGGLVSTLGRVKDLEVGIGITSEGRWVGGVSYDLKNLEKLGSDVSYAWGDTLKVSIGIWAGWDFIEEKIKYGVNATFIEIEFY